MRRGSGVGMPRRWIRAPPAKAIWLRRHAKRPAVPR